LRGLKGCLSITIMFDPKKLVRPNVLSLKPYSSARDEFGGLAQVSLDANENPFGFGLNRYPDASLKKLKQTYAKYASVNSDQLIFGNGSDEIIDLLIRAFCIPGRDKILIFPPTFGMYKVAAGVSDVEVLEAPLTADFQIDESTAKSALATPDLKIVFICSPNNPTGNKMKQETILDIINSFNGLVVVDEAYVDFCDQDFTKVALPNLFILRTFSKSFGLAGIRLGVGIGNPEVVELLNRIKAPYNVNSITQEEAIKALEHPQKIKNQVDLLLKEREILKEELLKVSSVKKVYPSDANSLLVAFDDAKNIYNKLLKKGIVVRDRSSQVSNTLRITVGKPEENKFLLDVLNNKAVSKSGRIGSAFRQTKETQISVEVNLDDPSNSYISTGVAFYDHMLDQLARHGAIGLKVEVNGDLEIDAHHTIEDTALAIGKAFDEALGDRKGMERYGFLLPMDDSLAQVAIDFGGRPWLMWDVAFKSTHLGDMPTEMASHFFKSFSDTARCNLNIKAEGDNDHHILESIFKAFARAIKMAVRKDDSGVLPSTKGVL